MALMTSAIALTLALYVRQTPAVVHRDSADEHAAVEAFMQAKEPHKQPKPSAATGCPVCPKRDPESRLGTSTRRPGPIEKPHDAALARVIGAIGWTASDLVEAGGRPFHWASSGRYLTLMLNNNQEIIQEEGEWVFGDNRITRMQATRTHSESHGDIVWDAELTWLLAATRSELAAGVHYGDYRVGSIDPRHYVVVRDGCESPETCLDFFDIRLGKQGDTLSIQRVVHDDKQTRRTIIWFNSERP